LYDDEIAFFRNAKIRSATSFDKDVLGAEIRFLAHVLEKDIIAHDQRRFRHLRRELAEKTAIWQKSFPIDDPTYDWAVNILRLYDSNTKEGVGSATIVYKPDLLEIIRTRRSIRRWKTDAIPSGTVLELIDAGRHAPSSCNRQPWRFLVVKDKEKIDFLGKSIAGGIDFLGKAPLIIVVLVDARLYHLPHERHLSYLDGAAAAENILLAAHCLGLGACLLNWSITKSREKKFFEFFNIANYMLPIALIAVGYPIPDLIPLARRRIEDIVIE